MSQPHEMRKNIERVLFYLGLSDTVIITREEGSTVYGWTTDGRLLQYVVTNNWITDLKEGVEHFHGSSISFREPASPSLQVVFHLTHNVLHPYFVELDLDFYPPSWRRPHWLLLHGLEVVRNALTGKPTDPAEMARALDKRFGPDLFCRLCRHRHIGVCREPADNAQFSCGCPGPCGHGKHPAYCWDCLDKEKR